MKITNKHNLNWLLVKWLSEDDYDYHPGVYSATTLLKPVRQVLLYERHWDEMEADVMDFVRMRFGTAWHDSMEKALKDDPSLLVEKRLFTVVNVDGREMKISGKPDAIEWVSDGVVKLYDHKSTSVWKVIKKDTDEWIIQLSIYRYIISCETDDYVDDEAEINLLFTDWQKDKAGKDDDYPDYPIMSMKIKLMSLKETEEFIKRELKKFIEHENTADNDLPYCTSEELWSEPDIWAIYPEGSDRCKKRCYSEEEANEYVKNMKTPARIEFRKGKAKRCAYCSARPFCNQYKELSANGLVKE